MTMTVLRAAVTRARARDVDRFRLHNVTLTRRRIAAYRRTGDFYFRSSPRDGKRQNKSIKIYQPAFNSQSRLIGEMLVASRCIRHSCEQRFPTRSRDSVFFHRLAKDAEDRGREKGRDTLERRTRMLDGSKDVRNTMRRSGIT